MTELFPLPAREPLSDGALLLRGFARDEAPDLLADLATITAASPFRHMIVPTGQRMSVAMTNAGTVGWITDRTGYRYDPLDPESGKPWPALPASFRTLAARAADAAGFSGFAPDGCLINRYEPGSRLTPPAGLACWGFFMGDEMFFQSAKCHSNTKTLRLSMPAKCHPASHLSAQIPQKFLTLSKYLA